MRTEDVIDNQPLSWYLAKEQEVATAVQEPTFFTWIAPPTVIYGFHQVAEQEMNIPYCQAHDIAMVQRHSGGGCVYADRGNVMLSYITPDTHSEQVFANFIKLVAQALQQMGYPAVSTEHNDILVNGHKVSGSACQALKNATIVHSTMLYDVDFEVLQKVLTPSKEKLQKHAVQSVRQRVMNLKTMQDMGSTEQFRQTLQQTIINQEGQI
ncbi:MAG: lipoate--protein ligase family protein [Paludibacteraceae bacterium]|nr:lipoate--protein ligase family protein [Paludibacteraceae bacterium]